jgi:transposase
VTPVVDTLQALRGVQFTGAVTPVAALGDLTRVENPRPLMNFLGADPLRILQRCATPAGDHDPSREYPCASCLSGRAWASRDPAKVTRHLPRRLETPPKGIQDLSWKAQVRRCQRSRRLVAKGTQANVVTGAMARALVGFLWAMAKEVPVTPSGHTTDGPFTPHSEGWPTCLGRGAAPVWCHPRRRDETPRPYSSLA